MEMKLFFVWSTLFVWYTTAFRKKWFNSHQKSSFQRAIPSSSWAQPHSVVEDESETSTPEDFAGYQDRVRVMHDVWNSLLFQSGRVVLQERNVNMLNIAEHLAHCQSSLDDNLYDPSSIQCTESFLELSTRPFQPSPSSTTVNKPPLFPAEPDDQVVLDVTKRWVQAMIADFAVCPFTIQADRAGIPRGDVRYTVSRATTLLEAFQVIVQPYMILLRGMHQLRQWSVTAIVLVYCLWRHLALSLTLLVSTSCYLIHILTHPPIHHHHPSTPIITYH